MNQPNSAIPNTIFLSPQNRSVGPVAANWTAKAAKLAKTIAKLSLDSLLHASFRTESSEGMQ